MTFLPTPLPHVIFGDTLNNPPCPVILIITEMLIRFSFQTIR